MAKYDVFISCKSEDYVYAEEIYEFLQNNGVNAFLASKELRKLGESEYRKAISAAMKDAYHMIVFASKSENIDSPWVYYEWDMFVNAKLKGYKPGNIITILKNIPTNEINMDLWKYESLPFEDYQKTILRYVETKESIERLKKINELDQINKAKQLKEEEERKRIEELRSRLTNLAENYKKRLSELTVDADKIFGILKSLNIKTKKCTICGTDNDIKSTYCSTCGWLISPVDGLEGLEYLSQEKEKAAIIYRHIYNKNYNPKESASDMNSTAEIQSKLEEKDRIIHSLNQEIDKQKKCQKQKSESKSKDSAEKESSPSSKGIKNLFSKIFSIKYAPITILIILAMFIGLIGLVLYPITLLIYYEIRRRRNREVPRFYANNHKLFICSCIALYIISSIIIVAAANPYRWSYDDNLDEEDAVEVVEAVDTVICLEGIATEENNENPRTSYIDDLNALGDKYRDGDGTEQDYSKAIEYYRQSADRGDAYGQTNMGFIYYYGKGMEQNYSEALKWYKLAGEQGNSYAQFHLGYMYEVGQGVVQNYSEAIKWYKKAAIQGDADAQYNLGIMYELAQGVEQDYQEALKWYQRSADNGNQLAKEKLENY